MTALCATYRTVLVNDRDGISHIVPTGDAFFPEHPNLREKTVVAKNICARCPERAACLAGAIERDEPAGIWGGVDWTLRSRGGRDEASRLGLRRRPRNEEAA